MADPIPYRDYGEDKRKLMLRIMLRIEEMCAITKGDEKQTMKTFLTEWFHVDVKTRRTTSRTMKSKAVSSCETPGVACTPSSSPDNSDDDKSSSSESNVCPEKSSRSKKIVTGSDDDNSNDNKEIQLFRQEMDRFFAWAFYGKFHSKLKPDELRELDRIYQELEDRHDLFFPVRTDQEKHIQYGQPRCMTLEKVNAMYRPLLVYLLVYAMKIGGGVLLRIMGFRRMVASTGLVAWYRPGKKNDELASSSSSSSSSFLPMLFFHGIAPGGVNLYLPMLFFGLVTEPERPVFLFENRSISCAIDFHPLTEEQTVDGVVEVLRKCDNTDQKDLSLVGHSFGSCLITWLLASKRLPNVKQVVLMDPVSILLSEPDVMVNFLYAEELDKIRMVASSELFTEYYLRRHFAWYNSELWLEDVECPMLIGLSEKDEILNAMKVKQEVERHAKSAKLVYWKDVGHGACIQSPAKWRQLKQHMLEQELQIVQQKSN